MKINENNFTFKCNFLDFFNSAFYLCASNDSISFMEYEYLSNSLNKYVCDLITNLYTELNKCINNKDYHAVKQLLSIIQNSTIILTTMTNSLDLKQQFHKISIEINDLLKSNQENVVLEDLFDRSMEILIEIDALVVMVDF